MNSGHRNNFEDDFDTNRFSNSNNSSRGRGTRNRGNSRAYNESTPYSDSNTAYSNTNSNSNSNNFQHKRGDSGSEVTSPTYRTNTYSSTSPTSKQNTFNNSEDFAYSTSTLNNLYQPEHAANTGVSPLSNSKRVDPSDYYELSSYNNRGTTLENTNEEDYNPNVYDAERIYLPPHVTVSASGGTAQEIPYYPQRESHLYDEYLNRNNQNSYNNTNTYNNANSHNNTSSYNTNSYNSHYEEDLMHPNSRTYLDPNATNYARPMNPYVTPAAAPIYNPQTLVSQVPSNNKRNWWKYPYFTFFITLVQVGVFAYQLYSNYYYTSNPIATHPINFMIGPSRSNLIHQGARFVPCMRPGFSDSPVECLQNNNGLGQPLCPLPEVCGFENFSNGQPNQWFRFITPIFLHAGVLHILFNLFSQLTLGGHLEKYWGPFRIFFIYFASGIGGFLFGGVYAMPDLPSVGASGAIFGLVGCELVDLIQNWKYIGSPGCQLFKLVITIAINFALGLLPFIDNFSHIGGFIVGVLCSILIIPLPSRMPKKVILIKWTFMAAAFGVLVYLFYFGATGFYDDKMRDSCTWCKYLNCLPVFPICKNPTGPGSGL